ncbi:hypothetical protein C8R45DRAFT_1166628 [Mycena sanguinolenta]|nr:hypothetical protein C8R45DRAFT_1166628 [Mycena sanguinolenta]
MCLASSFAALMRGGGKKNESFRITTFPYICAKSVYIPLPPKVDGPFGYVRVRLQTDPPSTWDRNALKLNKEANARHERRMLMPRDAENIVTCPRARVPNEQSRELNKAAIVQRSLNLDRRVEFYTSTQELSFLVAIREIYLKPGPEPGPEASSPEPGLGLGPEDSQAQAGSGQAQARAYRPGRARRFTKNDGAQGPPDLHHGVICAALGALGGREPCEEAREEVSCESVDFVSEKKRVKEAGSKEGELRQYTHVHVRRAGADQTGGCK